MTGPALLLIAFGSTTACVTNTVRSVDMTAPQQASEPVPEDLLLDVGVAVFDANVPEDYDQQIKQNVSPEVRRAEGNYIAYILKNMLQSTANWGAVRVVPRPTNAIDVNVSGVILESDGALLRVEVTVVDTSGVLWFKRPYEGLASKYAYDPSVPANIDPFQMVYRQISDDMLAYRQTLQPADVTRIRTIAEMKFARDFSPDAFASYLETTKKDQVVVKRLPAQGDPMLARIRKVREREYAFIDTLDEYYAEFDRVMAKPYQEWRGASYAEAIAYRELQAQARARMVAGIGALAAGVAGEFGSNNSTVNTAGWVAIGAGAGIIKSALNKRAQAQIHAEVLQELGQSAEAEISPHSIDLENETVRLTGNVDAQYAELRRILRQRYYEDLGLVVPEAPPAPSQNSAADRINVEPVAGS